MEVVEVVTADTTDTAIFVDIISNVVVVVVAMLFWVVQEEISTLIEHGCLDRKNH